MYIGNAIQAIRLEQKIIDITEVADQEMVSYTPARFITMRIFSIFCTVFTQHVLL